MNVLYCITGMLLISVGFSQRKKESLSSLAILRNENGDAISLDECSPLLSCSVGQTAFIASTRIVCREKYGLTEIYGSQNCRVFSSKIPIVTIGNDPVWQLSIMEDDCSILSLSVVRGDTNDQVFPINSSGFRLFGSGLIMVNITDLYYPVTSFHGEVINVNIQCSNLSHNQCFFFKVNGTTNIYEEKFGGAVKNDITLLSLWVNEEAEDLCTSASSQQPLPKPFIENYWIWFVIGGIAMFFIVVWIGLIVAIAKMIRIMKTSKRIDLRMAVHEDASIASSHTSKMSEKNENLQYEGSNKYDDFMSI